MAYSIPKKKQYLQTTYTWNGTDTAGVANSTAAAHPTAAIVPSNCVVTDCFYVVTTTFATAGADAGTIAAHIQSAGDLKAAIAVSTAGDVWDAGVRGCLPGAYLERTVAGDTAVLDTADRAASLILTTADRAVTFTVGGQALTAGSLTLVIEYYQL